MSRQRIHWDDFQSERRHQDKLQRKVQKIQGLRALLEMWEGRPDTDYHYILELRAKLRSAENQFNAMKP